MISDNISYNTSNAPTAECNHSIKISGPFFKCEVYNGVGSVVSSFWLDKPPHIDNYIEGDCVPLEEKEMAKINRNVTVNGKRHCIRANTEQEYADKLVKLLDISSSPDHETDTKAKHDFAEYAWNWFEVYSKPNIDTVTQNTYKRQIKRYLVPAFDGKAVEDISVDDVQRLFNNIDGAKATKDKVKMVLNQILDNAVEDGLLDKNPLKSKRVKITGAPSKPTEPYSVEQMQYLVQHLGDIQNPIDRAYLALHALHPLRLEEVLGLKWSDIDFEQMTIHVQRAVTHPARNRPEIKDTKTESSVRVLGLVRFALPYLTPGAKNEFILGGKKPLSYTQVRAMRERIQRDTGFEEKIVPIRFRTTVLTDSYHATKDIKLVQQMAGHTTSAMTLKYYVKGREDVASAAQAIERAYTQ